MKSFIRKIVFVVICLLVLANINYQNTTREINKNMIDNSATEEKSVTDKEKLDNVYNDKDSYPEELLEMLSRNNDMLDYVYKYKENKGKVFANDIGKIERNTVPLLFQYDERWGYGMYGDEVLAINGCGPTSVAMVIASLTGRNIITPYDVASYAYENGYYKNGTRWNFFTEGVRNYGIVGKE